MRGFPSRLRWVPGVGALRPVMEGPLGNGGVEIGKKPRFCFQISESANPVHLVISDDDAKAVLDLVNKTGLCNREPADVSFGPWWWRWWR